MPHPKKRERGSALILVIGVLVLLSIIGTTFVAIMRIERSAARNFNTDATLRQLALQALAFCMEHPNWDPNAAGPPYDIDNDNIGGEDSLLFTQPLLQQVTSDLSPRWAVLKKPFGGRLNVNWNSFYVGANSDNHILNEGTSPGEVSLVDPIAAYLDFMGASGISTGTSAENRAVAHEIARRICNLRHGVPLRPLGAPPYPTGTSANARPGEDGVDDDVWLNDSTLTTASDPPLGNDPDDDDRWAGPLAAGVPALNWRSQTAYNMVDDDGDGVADEGGEDVDEPLEFTQHPDPWLLPNGLWPVSDDQPFGTADLTSIVVTPSPASDLKTLVNDVCQVWAPGQGYPFDGTGATDYFEYLKVLFTTRNRDYMGNAVPLNDLNILMPGSPTVTERLIVDRDRARFVSALAGVFEQDGMAPEPASLTAWQALANLIDFLDSDPDPTGTLGDLGLLTALVRSQGWKAATDDDNGNGKPDPGEPNTRTFIGTERQPYINEIYVYNRTDDNFDNDHDTVDDDNDPLLHPLPLEDPGSGDTRNGYYIELYNHYNSDIVLFNNPADPANDPTVDWYLRILDNADPPAVVGTYYLSSGQVGEIGTGWAAGATEIIVPAGGYLIIESRNWAVEPTSVAGETENDWLGTNGFTKLPDPLEAGTMPAGVPIVNLGLAPDVKLFEPDFTIELVYSYDEDGTAGAVAPVEAVVDRQKVPSNVISIEGGTDDGTRDFAPSWERHDPRLARVVRDRWFDNGTFTTDYTGEVLMPTWAYRDAENTAPGTGGDDIRFTLGAVNDANDADADVFDGNYDLGWSTSESYDDLVDVPNVHTWKFANPGALGKLLCVGPTPADPADYGWHDPAAVDPGDDDYWLVTSSPYTQVPANETTPSKFQKMPLDAKKINFTEMNVYDWNADVTYAPEPDAAPDNYPTGRATGVFDAFATIAFRGDGKDNDGDWDRATDETDATDTDGDGTPDPAPTPGDAHVDEADEIYVPGRIDVNNSNEYVLSGLPYVKFDDSTFYRPGLGDVAAVFLTAVTDPVTGSPGIIDERAAGGPFQSRADFYRRVVRPAVNSEAPRPPYNPGGGTGAFGKDTEDNHRYEDGGVFIRDSLDYRWETLQQPPRTTTANLLEPHDFILPGADAFADGRDMLIDDKTETDYTVGALMNMVGLDMELPEAFAGGGDLGVYTYYITVQLTDGADVNGDGVSVGDEDRDGIGITEPDWDEGSVIAEKRIIVLVDTTLPTTDPGRVRVFNWAVEGRAPER